MGTEGLMRGVQVFTGRGVAFDGVGMRDKEACSRGNEASTWAQMRCPPAASGKAGESSRGIFILVCRHYPEGLRRTVSVKDALATGGLLTCWETSVDDWLSEAGPAGAWVRSAVCLLVRGAEHGADTLGLPLQSQWHGTTKIQSDTSKHTALTTGRIGERGRGSQCCESVSLPALFGKSREHGQRRGADWWRKRPWRGTDEGEPYQQQSPARSRAALPSTFCSSSSSSPCRACADRSKPQSGVALVAEAAGAATQMAVGRASHGQASSIRYDF
jgi:hypothetical protein